MVCLKTAAALTIAIILSKDFKQTRSEYFVGSGKVWVLTYCFVLNSLNHLCADSICMMEPDVCGRGICVDDESRGLYYRCDCDSGYVEEQGVCMGGLHEGWHSQNHLRSSHWKDAMG